MGLQDRDWYQKALSEREKQRKIDETRSRFSVFSRKHLGAKIVSPTKTGFIPMMVFWCAVMGLLYMLMTHYLKPKPLVMSASGELIMPRARDGHFYARGEVNGKRVSFLVDTGCLLGHRQ
jgi:aspartyl protease family protein